MKNRNDDGVPENEARLILVCVGLIALSLLLLGVNQYLKGLLV